MPVPWNSGSTDASSGDRTWHIDFSTVTQTGRYFVLDADNNKRSYEFEISPIVYNEVLKQAMRMFFYQRSGFPKDARYAGSAWADGASHIGPMQDKNCRLFNDKNNPSTERDLSGGWYDAGDYNKYTNWTANYIVEMMKAWLENPRAWADNYNIPESGNGLPDLLDEARWGIDFLLRMQQPDGSVLCIVAESHASPPSSATGQSLYGPATTSASLNTAAALALASKVYKQISMNAYADTLLARATKAWTWAIANPDVIFNNNSPENSSLGVGAGNQEEDEYTQSVSRLEAACFLFEATGDMTYREFFDANYQSMHLIAWSYAYPYEPIAQDLLLYYTGIPGASPAVANQIKNTYKNAMAGNADNFPAFYSGKDPYGAHLAAYTWGSNGQKGAQGSMYFNLISYAVDMSKFEDARQAAAGYIHYIHGVNPLNMVYLSNMYAFGAGNSVNEFYHSWFCDGSAKWDRVGTSLFGPPPGFLTGGPNPSYNWASCCPGGCGSVENNAACLAVDISPPKNQPKQKSYKDFNSDWPLDSWEITENSCGYQVNYIRLLSKFVDIYKDCHGDSAGTARLDTCGICNGGLTGSIPEQIPCHCSPYKRKAVISDVACGEYVSPSGKYTWDSTGVYDDTLVTVTGCDSILIIKLTVPKVNTFVTSDGKTITAEASGDMYRWLQCGTPYIVIDTAVSQSYTPGVSGSYAVEVTHQACADTSSCIQVDLYAVISNTLGEGFSVYPNPASSTISIHLPAAFESTDIEITDLQGRSMMFTRYHHQQTINLLLNAPDGIYLLKVVNNRNKQGTVRIVLNSRL